MELSQHTSTVYVRLDAIRRNFQKLLKAAAASGASRLVPAALPDGFGPERPGSGAHVLTWPGMIAVVKADAYGHGHIPVALTLLEEGAALFASGSVQEAVQLRQGLAREADKRGVRPGILSLLGPVGPEDAALASHNGIIPVIHSFAQLALMEKTRLPLAVALKFNSGMNRLGFEPNEAEAVIRSLKRLEHIRPVLALSHLACADGEDGSEAVRAQARAFAGILEQARAVWPGLAASLANSAGLFAAGEIAGCIGPHICRPGIGLYGGNPFAGTSREGLARGLEPAMSVSAPIIATRRLKAGSSIGYGHTYTAEKDMRVGIIAAGYADFFPRFMSNRGRVCIGDASARVLGRVSMQMTAVDLEECPDARSGDEAWLLGGPSASAVGIDELAALWGSISYEVFCLLGRGNRVYIGAGPHE